MICMYLIMKRVRVKGLENMNIFAHVADDSVFNEEREKHLKSKSDKVFRAVQHVYLCG